MSSKLKKSSKNSKKGNSRVKGKPKSEIARVQDYTVAAEPLPTQHSETIGQRPQGKQEYKDILFKIFKSDYLRNLPQAIAGIVITGLLTKYILFDSRRTEATNAETQTINNLTSNFMHDLFFEDVNNRQIVNNLHEELSEIDQNLRSQLHNIRTSAEEESKDENGNWLKFYIDPNKGEWI
jgi:hypothetical protein